MNCVVGLCLAIVFFVLNEYFFLYFTCFYLTLGSTNSGNRFAHASRCNNGAPTCSTVVGGPSSNTLNSIKSPLSNSAAVTFQRNIAPPVNVCGINTSSSG